MKKSNIIRKGLILATAAVTMATASGCKNDTSKPSDFPKDFYYYKYVQNDHIAYRDGVHKDIINNGAIETGYNCANILISIDKDTYESHVYIYSKSEDVYISYGYYFDFDTGYYLLKDVTNGVDYNHDKQNYDLIYDNKYVVFLNELDVYLGDYPLKSYYTKEEIYEIADLLSQKLKEVNNDYSLHIK